MAKKIVRDALIKFAVGDGLTDEELDALIEFFNKSEDALTTLFRYFDPTYELVLRDIRKNSMVLGTFKDARERCTTRNKKKK